MCPPPFSYIKSLPSSPLPLLELKIRLTPMDFSWPENTSADRKKAVHQLIRGREIANQLRDILGKPFGHDGLVVADDLVMKILGSFTQTISILNRPTATDEVSQIPANNQVGSPCWEGRRSEDSDESSKTSASKDRRGCYKRRKTLQTWTKITPTLIDDGHAWRKYGQKQILNAKHPRNYFRCTHKFDQGCQATKQVQRTGDDPATYRTTYHGQHTCKNLLKPPQIILDSTVSTTPGESSFLLSFGSGNPNTKSHEPLYPTFPLVKQEYKEGKPSLDQNQSSSSDYLLPPDLTTFESSGPVTALSSGSDHGDVISSGVYSCSTASTHSHSFDMDLMVGAVDFDDVLEFDF